MRSLCPTQVSKMKLNNGPQKDKVIAIVNNAGLFVDATQGAILAFKTLLDEAFLTSDPRIRFSYQEDDVSMA